MYKIHPQIQKNRVLIVFDGEFDYDQTEFAEEIKKAVLTVRSTEREFDLLADYSKVTVMDQSRASRSEEIVAWCVDNGLRKSANVMNSALQRIQIKRLASQNDKWKFFETLSEAEMWLDE
ncbi:MAG: hypothetical protein ABJP48_05695 [Erythrobacter sp.]